jgi:dolichyl-phosphate-mannose--protein O-mannosyl transferase
LCNAIVLQQLWEWGKRRGDPVSRTWGIGATVAAVVLIAAAFVFFYPILAAVPLTWTQWHWRMWFPTWIVGPG